MRIQILAQRNSPAEHGFRLRPVLFDQQGKVDMADEAGHQGGREKAVEKAAVKNEIPAQAEKGKGKEVPERFPDHKSGQDQAKEIPGHGPMKEDLARVVFVSQRIKFRKAEEVFEDG